jgi:hypothetical protein
MEALTYIHRYKSFLEGTADSSKELNHVLAYKSFISEVHQPSECLTYLKFYEIFREFSHKRPSFTADQFLAVAKEAGIDVYGLGNEEETKDSLDPDKREILVIDPEDGSFQIKVVPKEER